MISFDGGRVLLNNMGLSNGLRPCRNHVARDGGKGRILEKGLETIARGIWVD